MADVFAVIIAFLDSKYKGYMRLPGKYIATGCQACFSLQRHRNGGNVSFREIFKIPTWRRQLS